MARFIVFACGIVVGMLLHLSYSVLAHLKMRNLIDIGALCMSCLLIGGVMGFLLSPFFSWLGAIFDDAEMDESYFDDDFIL